MKYVQHGSHFSKSSKRVKGGKYKKLFFIMVIALIVIVFLLLKIVGNLRNDEEVIRDIVDESESRIAQEVNQSEVFEKIVSDDNVKLSFVGEVPEGNIKSDFSGIARRVNEDGKFIHGIVASLPEIDQQKEFYEGWLVKPGVTDFFSTGEMFHRQDGRWGLLYEVGDDTSPSDIDEYVNIIITLEKRDGDILPSAKHILRGSFE